MLLIFTHLNVDFVYIQYSSLFVLSAHRMLVIKLGLRLNNPLGSQISGMSNGKGRTVLKFN